MAEGWNKKRKTKGIITQEDIHSLLQRYSVTTVITLLKEVAQVAAKKIDWNELVKKTATGISNAREYQMIWRHLAYSNTLEEQLDKSAVPMDDDSDLEFELEAYPPVSSEASTEAAACVKVMIASTSLFDANPNSVVEAPLSINIPSGWSSTAASANPQMQETKITVPVLVPKQPITLPTVPSVECLDANEAAAANLLIRRKRKPWSKKEDAELIAAVQRYGEGNWANILKGDFKGDRTASQLSQRWAIIRKRKEHSSVGITPPAADFHAVRRAFNMALDMPMGESSKSVHLNGKGNTITGPSNSMRHTAGEPLQPGAQHHRQDYDPMASSKSRYVNSMKPSISPALSPDAMVKAAAVAAGARIATPSDAATLLKAAQSKNAVHVKPSGPNSIKSSGPSNGNSLPPNVHYICTGLANRSTSGYNSVITNASKPVGTYRAQSQITRSSLPTAQTNPSQTANELKSPKERVSGEVIVISENDPTEQIQTSVPVSGSKANKSIQNHASVLHNEAKERAQEHQSALPGSKTHLERLNNNAVNPRCLPPSKVVGNTDVTCIGTVKQSEKLEENNMIEKPIQVESVNKLNPEQNRNGKVEANKISGRQVEEETEVKQIPEKKGSEMEENKISESPDEEEREQRKRMKI